MSEEQLKAFLDKLKAPTDNDAVFEIAKDAGFSVTADDLKRTFPTELSDEELREVTGGELPCRIVCGLAHWSQVPAGSG